MATHHLAADLGAESGRLILGTLAEERLTLREIHRFPNTPIQAGGSLHWDVPALFRELKVGLGKTAQLGLPISSFACDSWGLDYVFLDEAGDLIPPTFHYRDERCHRGVTKVRERIPAPKLFAETGIQFMPFNTVYQLAAESTEQLARAHRFLMIGDAFNYLLSGVARAEESLASTSQLYNPTTRSWSELMIQTLGLRTELFPQIVPSGTRLGALKPAVVKETGLDGIAVVASCSHDTGSAVAAVPASGTHWAYISSGTWSLLGVEFPVPLITEACRELNFTNEIGYGGSTRLLKNLVGLWIVQECRRAWAAEGTEMDYALLSKLAGEAPPFVSLIDPSDSRFLSPGGMPRKVAEFCKETGQPEPAGYGATIRCVLESLALLYRRTLRQVERITGSRVRKLHVVGGGSQNALLNQFTANATEVAVLAGPSEATAAGNILVQAIALGHLPSLPKAREIIRLSTELALFEPQGKAEWDQARDRFEPLAARSQASNK